MATGASRSWLKRVTWLERCAWQFCFSVQTVPAGFQHADPDKEKKSEDRFPLELSRFHDAWKIKDFCGQQSLGYGGKEENRQEHVSKWLSTEKGSWAGGEVDDRWGKQDLQGEYQRSLREGRVRIKRLPWFLHHDGAILLWTEHPRCFVRWGRERIAENCTQTRWAR